MPGGHRKSVTADRRRVLSFALIGIICGKTLLLFFAVTWASLLIAVSDVTKMTSVTASVTTSPLFLNQIRSVAAFTPF